MQHTYSVPEVIPSLYPLTEDLLRDYPAIWKTFWISTKDEYDTNNTNLTSFEAKKRMVQWSK